MIMNIDDWFLLIIWVRVLKRTQTLLLIQHNWIVLRLFICRYTIYQWDMSRMLIWLFYWLFYWLWRLFFLSFFHLLFILIKTLKIFHSHRSLLIGFKIELICFVKDFMRLNMIVFQWLHIFWLIKVINNSYTINFIEFTFNFFFYFIILIF